MTYCMCEFRNNTACCTPRLVQSLAQSLLMARYQNEVCPLTEFNTNLFKNENITVTLRFNELTVWKPKETSWFRNKVNTKTAILNDVSGEIKDNDFIAVIGPSGAGKTTFLAALAGKCNLPTSGRVEVNSIPLKDVASGFVEIVPQFEAFMDHITVAEHLYFMIEMKLCNCSNIDKAMKIKYLMKELKLKKHENSLIRHLSGGEKRLLSTATSLLSNPKIIICDEPTTGLDVYSASLVVVALKKLASARHIVICSIHQPSSDLFREFKSIMLLADGKLLYHGSQLNCEKLFKGVGLPCPENYNPADFYIRVISDTAKFTQDSICKIHKSYYSQNRSKPKEMENTITLLKFSDVSKPNWFKQVFLLCWRYSLSLTRDFPLHLFQLFLAMIMSSIAIGFSFFNVTGTNQEGVQNIRGFLWLLVSEVSFAISYDALWIFDYDLTLFKREIGVYDTSAFYMSRFICKLPKCFIWPMAFVILATLAVDLPNHLMTVMKFLIVLVGTAIASVSYGIGMGALITSTGIVMDIMPCVDLPLFLCSGAFVRLASLPVWMNALRYVSHFYYGMDAISNVYWRQIKDIDCPANSTNACIKDGTSVLAENGYLSNFYFQDSFGLLFVACFWCVLGYCGLRREAKKGYAY